MYSSQGASHSFRGGGGKYGGAARSHSDGYVYEEGGYNSGGYNSGGYNSGGYNSGGYNSGGYGGDYRGSGYDNADSAHYGRDVSRSRSHGSYGGERCECVCVRAQDFIQDFQFRGDLFA